MAATGRRGLCLPYTAHTDAGMKELAALAQLRTLTLGQTGNAGLNELAALEHLETLHILSTSVTDAGMKALPRMKAILRTLRCLRRPLPRRARPGRSPILRAEPGGEHGASAAPCLRRNASG